MGHYDNLTDERDDEYQLHRLKERINRRSNIMVFKKLRPYAVIPTQGTSYAAGFDLHYCPWTDPKEDLRIPPGEIKIVPAGVAVALPRGYHGQIWQRSGNAVKLGLTTEAGIIDEDYRGELGAICANRSDKDIVIRPGDRVAQMVVVAYFAPGTLDPHSALIHEAGPDEELVPCGTRGANAYGSTGR